MARLRHTVLADLAAANAALAPLLASLNERPFQKLPGSRASVFATLDAPELGALAAQPWQWATFKTVKVHIDYHVEVQGHRYSVAHSLVGLALEARVTDALDDYAFLANGGDLIKRTAPEPEWVAPKHDNVRGAAHYH